MKVKDWVENFERNIPEGYPELVTGWPDEEHGISWRCYINELIDKLDDLYEGAQIPTISFDEWKQIKRKEGIERDILGHSYLDCDLCGCIAGSGLRYAVTALPGNVTSLTDEHLGHDYVPLSVCRDCKFYIVNGRAPDWLVKDDD